MRLFQQFIFTIQLIDHTVHSFLLALPARCLHVCIVKNDTQLIRLFTEPINRKLCQSLNMNKLLFLLLFLSSWAFAQNSTVRGVIRDKQSETPLAGVTVQMLPAPGKETAPIGGITDAEGQFVLKGVPVGRQALRVTYLGYETQNLPNVLITAGKEVQLDVRLEESFNTMAEVVIKAATNKDQPKNELAAISARQFNTEEVMRYSGGRSDVGRLVSNFAGVAANNDARNDIVIRGNSPTGVLWRMEGIPIPNPNHFATLGTTGGPVSALNPNLIGNSDFMTGAFSAEYGNALAGVFDINLRTGNRERFEATAQIGAFTGMEAMIEGPLNRKNDGSFVVAYRHSFVEVANAAGINVGTAALPLYKDLSFNLDFGNTKAGKFSLFGIGADSKINFIGPELDTTDLFANPNQNAFNTSRFGVLGLKHNLLLNDRSYIRTVLSASFSGGTYKEEDLELLENNKPYQLTDVSNELLNYQISSFYNTKINKRMTVRAGVILQNQHLNTFVKTRQGTPDLDGDGRRDWYTQRDFDGVINLGEAYAQTQYRLTEKVTLNAGLHAQYFDQTEDFALEPRAAINWQVAPKHKISLGYGLHNQTQALPVFFFREQLPNGETRPSNTNLDYTRSQHFVLGYDFKPAADWRIKAETYYQAIDRVAIDAFPSDFSMLNTGADFVFPEKPSLVSEGTGRNYGAELTLEKFFSKGYYGLMTVSLFDSKYKGSDGVLRNTAFNGGYVFNVLAGRELRIGSSGRRFLTFDTKFTMAGGRPYSPVDLDASRRAGREITVANQAFTLRQNDYLRWDAKMGFRLNSAKRKFSQTFFLDFQNVTNRENIFAMRYNAARGTVGRINQIGFFPDMLYRVEF